MGLLEMSCGVYKMNFPDGGAYVGSSRDIDDRFRHHRAQLRGHRHTNNLLQLAFNKFGDPKLQIILICRIVDLKFYEQLIMDNFDSRYNLSILSHRSVMTEAGKQRIRESKLRLSDHARKLLSEAGKKSSGMQGMKHTEEAKKKMAVSKIGKTLSPQIREKISETKKGCAPTRLGAVITEETRSRMCAAQTARWAKHKTRKVTGLRQVGDEG